MKTSNISMDFLLKLKGSLAIEGLSCSGKTTLAKYLSRNLNAALIPEWALNIQENLFHNSIYQINDIVKSKIFEATFGSNVISDRYFISTILCDVVYRGKRNIDELIKSYSEKYLLPDYWIYLRITPEESFDRLKKYRLPSTATDTPWLNPEYIHSLFCGYESIFSSLDNVIEVPSNYVYKYVCN
ncbi:AAA family ATPase [Xenorhabdus sp. Flor]|uniref:hypothetical protein n=1 Tax=Xenorhabdus cabanillasii TaxID=351673 RepID=UPI0019BA0ACA|nr:hypothetical protein [Xenorhabdus sp. Flor]MBD2816063.1 AAA family ATPase [Xenorhabdus sp. Flor]